MSTPLVSVIIPTRNRKDYLRLALDSVLDQTFQNFEILVADDGSTDGTARMLEADYPRVVCHRSEFSQGASAARNTLLRSARGVLLAFLDDDDGWRPDFLEHQVRAFELFPEAALSFCNYRLLRTDGSWAIPCVAPTQTYADRPLHLLSECYIHTMSLVVISAAHAGRAGAFDERLRLSHDVDFYYRLLPLGPFCHISLPLAWKREHCNSLVSGLTSWIREENQLFDRLAPPTAVGRVRAYRSLFFARLFLARPRGWWPGMALLLRSLRSDARVCVKVGLVKLWRRLTGPAKLQGLRREGILLVPNPGHILSTSDPRL